MSTKTFKSQTSPKTRKKKVFNVASHLKYLIIAYNFDHYLAGHEMEKTDSSKIAASSYFTPIMP